MTTPIYKKVKNDKNTCKYLMDMLGYQDEVIISKRDLYHIEAFRKMLNKSKKVKSFKDDDFNFYVYRKA
jgi:hypothetical protein